MAPNDAPSPTSSSSEASDFEPAEAGQYDNIEAHNRKTKRERERGGSKSQLPDAKLDKFSLTKPKELQTSGKKSPPVWTGVAVAASLVKVFDVGGKIPLKVAMREPLEYEKEMVVERDEMGGGKSAGRGGSATTATPEEAEVSKHVSAAKPLKGSPWEAGQEAW